jgi:hypothetical protein
MKKFLTIFICILLVVAAGFVYWRFFWVLGAGVNAGQLKKLNKKSYFLKTN